MTRPAPLTHGGRQTLIYLVLAGAGPTLTGVVVWAMVMVRDWTGANPVTKLDAFARLAWWICLALFVIVVALACFVSIRAVRIGRDGLTAEANDNGEDQPVATVTTTTTVATPPLPPPTK